MQQLRKIYGPIQEGDICRIRDNKELNRSITGKDIVKFIKAQSIRWLGHVKKNGSGSNVKKDGGRKTVHRQKKRKTPFETDDVVADLKPMKIKQWMEKI